MLLLELTLPTLAENLALEEALLLQAEAGRGGDVLRFWEWPFLAVVLGAGGRLARDVDEAACSADGVEIARRSSGGGTVLLGPGCLCYSLILSFERDDALREIGSSYRYILSRTAVALEGLLPSLRPDGISDLTSESRKFSGNAQQRKSRYILHHGTLLTGFDMGLVRRYLRAPERQPEYREGRGHAEFLVNLPATTSELKCRLKDTWKAETPLGHWPNQVVRMLVEQKYRREEWVRRRL